MISSSRDLALKTLRGPSPFLLASASLIPLVIARAAAALLASFSPLSACILHFLLIMKTLELLNRKTQSPAREVYAPDSLRTLSVRPRVLR